jgi:flagellar motor switch protein FliN/FliY
MARSPDLHRALGLEVPLIVVLGERQMRLSEVVSLVPGAIIELQKGAEEELQLLANNKPIATGMAVKVGENFGIRISYVGDLRERIAALASPSALATCPPGGAGAPHPAAPPPPARAGAASAPAASPAAAGSA